MANKFRNLAAILALIIGALGLKFFFGKRRDKKKAPKRTLPSGEPNPTAMPGGEREVLGPKDTAPENIAANEAQDEAAHQLARAGFKIDRLAKIPNEKSPDYNIEGNKFDHVAPTSPRARNIWKRILDEKINTGQTDRIVLNLKNTDVSLAEIQKQFAEYPMPGLKELIVITKDGQIVHLVP